jgi:predicted transcriptional regulator
MKEPPFDYDNLTGDQALAMIAALANPHRLRIIAALFAGRTYVSQLARDLQMSRPLLHLHLQKMEAAGLITGTLELSDDGKAMKYYAVAPFLLVLSPERIASLVKTLSGEDGTTER